MAGLDTLDEFSPRDTDAVSLGDDAIRETRAKTKGSVGLEHYLDGVHKVPGGTQATRPAAGRAGRVYYNSDQKAVEYDNGSAWLSVADAKARATILWHAGTVGPIPNASPRWEVPFDYIIDDPGGYASVANHQIIQPANSIGMVSLYMEYAPPTNAGLGIFNNIEQFDGTAWQILAQGFVGPVPFISLNTMVDSRWGLQLRVTVSNYLGAFAYINATALGASPRFGYAMLGRTA